MNQINISGQQLHIRLASSSELRQLVCLGIDRSYIVNVCWA